MKKQSFVYGAMILFLASLLNRIVGFGYQIAVIRLIKPEGVGLFNMVYPVYILALVLSSMGIPVAIAKLVAQEVAKGNLRKAYRIFYLCLFILLLSSSIVTLGLYWAAPWLATHYFPNPNVFYCFLTLIPAIVIVSICSAFRGFFQGLQQMTPTAVTQILEQLVRVTAGLSIAYLLLPRGVEYAAIGISLGVVCGEIIGCTTMLFIYWRSRPYIPRVKAIKSQSTVMLLKPVFALGIPVTLTRFVSTALMSVDAIMIPHRLQGAGMSLQQATATYGQLVGIAQTLVMFPCIITIAMATALIPAVSDALAQNNLRLVQARTAEAIRLTVSAGLPCVVILLCLPTEICGLLFGYQEAGHILAILALAGPFIYFSQTTTGILQGMGEAVKPFKNMLIASAFKIIGIYYLTGIPGIDIKGTAASFALFYFLYACLNYSNLKSLINYQINFKVTVVKPLLAATIMAGTIKLIKQQLVILASPLVIQLLFIMIISLLVYIIVLFLLGGITPRDMDRLKRAVKRLFHK